MNCYKIDFNTLMCALSSLAQLGRVFTYYLFKMGMVSKRLSATPALLVLT